jgi:hypothetical protein
LDRCPSEVTGLAAGTDQQDRRAARQEESAGLSSGVPGMINGKQVTGANPLCRGRSAIMSAMRETPELRV